MHLHFCYYYLIIGYSFARTLVHQNSGKLSLLVCIFPCNFRDLRIKAFFLWFCRSFNLPNPDQRIPRQSKEPTNGKVNDGTRQVFPDLQAENNSESEEECLMKTIP